MRVEEKREARRQQAARYEALAHMQRQRRRHQPLELGPDTIYRLEMGSRRAGSGRQGGQEGSGEVHSGQPSGGLRREEGQAGQSSAAAAARRGQQEGGQESGSQRSGQAGGAVQSRDADQKKAVRAGIVVTVRKGKERDKKGSRERDTGRRDSTEQAASGTGQRGERAKGRGRRVAMGTWAHWCSQRGDPDGGEV